MVARFWRPLVAVDYAVGTRERRTAMAVWKCKKCGFTKEGRCKPQKCPQCQEKGSFEKEEA